MKPDKNTNDLTARFSIPGTPIGKARPRVITSDTGSRAFTPQKTKDYEEFVRWCFLSQCKGAFFGTSKNVGTSRKHVLGGQSPNAMTKLPLSMEIHAFFPIPKNTSKKNKQLMLQGKIFPTKKPDLDNIAKAIADALNGVAYLDDSQIVSLNVSKVYAENPRVEVSIFPI